MEKVLLSEARARSSDEEAWIEALAFHRRVKRGEDSERRSSRKNNSKWQGPVEHEDRREHTSSTVDIPRSFSSRIMREDMAEIERAKKSFFAVSEERLDEEKAHNKGREPQRFIIVKKHCGPRRSLR